jgi:PAS domain S-box-containing protein
MSLNNESASPFWYPDSVLLCALLVTRQKKWWMYLLGPLPIRLFFVPSDSPVWFLLATFVNDSLKAYLTAMLLQFFLKNPARFDTLRDFLFFISIAALASPAIAAFEGALSRHLLGYPFWPSWQQWFLGNALASVILTPLILYWIIGFRELLHRQTFRTALEGFAAFIGLVISAFLAFKNQSATSYGSPVMLYAPVPFLLWLSVRFGLRGTSSAMAVIAFLLFDGAARNQGPFLADPLPERPTHIQFFLFVIGIPSLFVAVLSGERRQGINLLRKAYVTLRESEQRFREMADSAPVFIWMSGTDKLCTYLNRGWLEFTGRPLQKELGNGWADGVHPDDLASCLKVYISSFERRVPFEMEYRLRRRDGEFRWVLARGIPRHTPDGEFLGYLGSVIDITERKLTEEALRRSEELYREVVESQTDLVCRYRADTTLTFVNSACCKFFGWQSGDLIGRKFLELTPPNMWETVLQTINLIGEDHRVRTIEHEVPLPGAGIGWVHWSTYVILTPEGTVAEFQAIGSDITDRKRAEEAQESLSHASRLAVVGELTAMIAHEVNQPLTAILHSAEAGVKLMRLKQPPMGEIETILTDIKEYDLRAGQSIRRLRDLLQKHEMEVQPLNLNEVALDVIRLIAGDAQRRRIEVENYLEPGLPLILGDRVHLQQLLLNLAMNGMQAMTDSPLGLRRLIVQTSRKEDSTVELSVYDSGHGIPGDLLPHVFESFFTTKKDGMGLGLSIAKSIVQKHNGNIRVDSNPRGGAVFRIGLPAIPDSDLMDKDATPEPGDPAALSRPLNRPERNGI